jgi:tetratricopeptide (TPR) repeat protein
MFQVKKIKTRLRLVFLLSLFAAFTFSQIPKGISDSLRKVLAAAAHDSIRLNILTSVLENEQDMRQMLIYNKEQIVIAERALPASNDKDRPFYEQVLGTCYNNVGALSNALGELVNALDYLNKGYELMMKLKDPVRASSALGNMGVIYDNQGDYAKALDFFQKALKLKEGTEDKGGLVTCYVNIGNIHKKIDELKTAMSYYEKAAQIAENAKQIKQWAFAINCIGNVYAQMRDFDKALFYYEKSLKMRQELNEIGDIAQSFNNIGSIHKEKGEWEKAKEFFIKSLEVYKGSNDLRGTSGTLNNLAQVNFRLNEMTQAYANGKLSLEQSLKLGNPVSLMNAAGFMKMYYQKEGKYKEAFEMYGMQMKMQDSISKQDNKKAVMKKELEYHYEKKEMALKAEQDKKDALAAEQLKQKERERNYFVVGFILVGIFAFFALKGYRAIKKANVIIQEQKNLVEEKQREVMDSIRYAKRIQLAQIPSEKRIQAMLNRSKIK